MTGPWTARGHVWLDGSFSDGWVTVEAGAIVATGSGNAPGPVDARGVILPSFVNAHTHVGDHFVRGSVPPDATLAELVAPPHGLKHRLLAAATPETLRASLRDACRETFDAGTRVIYDFREGGVAGVRALQDAAAGTGVTPIALGRATAEDDAAAVARVADGLGLSALRDVSADELRAVALAARAAGKRFAVHWSEAERESVDAVLDVAPDFVVHATHATHEDVARLADARMPVVVCARSNERLLGRLPPLEALLDAGVPVTVGSDNAMLQTVSVLDELRFLHARFPVVAPAALVTAAVDTPRAVLDPPGGPGDLVVLAPAGPGPFTAVFSEAARVIARSP